MEWSTVSLRTHQNDLSYFRDNVAHSCGIHGVYHNNRPEWAYAGGPTEHPSVEGLRAWKCRQYGLWWRSYGVALLEGLQIADCRGGLYPATEGTQDSGSDFTGQIQVRDSLFVGVSEDHQSSQTVEYPQASTQFDGHALDWDVLAGVELYDGHLDLDGLRFAQYSDTQIQYQSQTFDRWSGALSQVAYESSLSENPQNRLRNCQFMNVDHRVFFRNLSTMPNMIRNTVVFDEDGSLGNGANMYYAVRTPALVANTHAGAEPAGDAFEGWYRLPQTDAPFAQITVRGIGGSLPAGNESLRVFVLDWNHALQGQMVSDAGTLADQVWPFNAILGNRVYGPGQETHGVYLCQMQAGVPSSQWPTSYQIEIEYAENVGHKVIVGVPLNAPVTNVTLEVDPPAFTVYPVVDADGDQDTDLDDLMLTGQTDAYVQVGSTVYFLTTTNLQVGTLVLPEGTKNIVRIQ